MRGKQVIIATLSGLLAMGVGFSASAKAKKSDNRQTIVNVSLKPTSQSDLTNYVYDTVDPTSANYHRYLTPAEFAQKFGQSKNYITSFKNYLKKYHVSATAYPGNLALKVKGTKTNVNRAFHAKYVSKAKTNYQLPGTLSKKVVAVIGIFAPNSKTAKKTTSKKSSAKQTAKQKIAYLKKIAKTANASKSDLVPNTKLSTKAFSKAYGPLKFADNYQLNALYNQGLQGFGQRVGIISNSDFHIGDIQKYWQKNGINAQPSQIRRYYTISSKKYARMLSNYTFTVASLEATLDLQQATSVAPKADYDVYIGLPVNGATTITSAHYTSFMEAIGDNIDRQISTSFTPGVERKSGWPDSSASPASYNAAFNLMLEQAAAQGITVFRATGDHGPYEDPIAAQNHAASTSPYQVMVGGTTLPYSKEINGKKVTVSKERAWGDTYTAKASELKKGFFPGGGGGGFSALNPTPRYQLGVPGVNTFRAIQLLKYIGKGKFLVNKQPKVITGTGHSRNLPDIAGDADPHSGYATYISAYSVATKNKKEIRTLHKIWLIGGGTSYVAPQMAAANAVMNSGRTTPLGFWNPQIYRFAQQADSPFNPLNDTKNNNNLYYTGQPGTVYNQASGLGTINFEKLFTQFNQETGN